MNRRLLPGLLALALIAASPILSSAQPPWTLGGQVIGATVYATWPPPPTGGPPASYQVEIVLASNNQNFAIVNVGMSLSFTATLPNGSYVMRVRALYAGGTSQVSSDAPFTAGPYVNPNAPLAPLDPRADLTTPGIALLTWNVTLASAFATSFIIDVGSAPALSNLGSFDTGSPVMALVAHPPPGTYYVRVRARNPFGVSPPSTEIAVTVTGPGGPCAAPPFAPVSLSATVVGLFATLNWADPLGTQAVTGHVIEVGSSAGLSNVLRTTVGVTTVLGAVASPGIYYARVRALNQCGQSGTSNEVVVVVPQ